MRDSVFPVHRLPALRRKVRMVGGRQVRGHDISQLTRLSELLDADDLAALQYCVSGVVVQRVRFVLRTCDKIVVVRKVSLPRIPEEREVKGLLCDTKRLVQSQKDIVSHDQIQIVWRGPQSIAVVRDSLAGGKLGLGRIREDHPFAVWNAAERGNDRCSRAFGDVQEKELLVAGGEQVF